MPKLKMVVVGKVNKHGEICYKWKDKTIDMPAQYFKCHYQPDGKIAGNGDIIR